MKNKRRMWSLVIIVALLVISGSVILYQQWETTTYGKVLDNIIVDDEDVQKVAIRYCNLEENADNDKEMTISDPKKITKIMEEPSNMKLERTSQSRDNLYVIEMKTDGVNYLLVVDDNDTLVTYGEKPLRGIVHQYKIMDSNKLVEAIESNDAKWESIGKSAETLESGGGLSGMCPGS